MTNNHKTLQQLLAELCPTGVPFKKLGEVTAWDKKFNGVDKKLQAKVIPYKYLLAKEAESIEVEGGDVFILNTGNKIAWTTQEKAGAYLADGEVISIPWGGYANVKYYNGRFVTTDNRICTSLDTSVLLNKFLYYYLKHNQPTLDSFYRGAGIKHPSMLSVLSFEIPVPPMAVQERIVEILDNFTALTAELQAELQARQKQYEYFRNRLLTFGGPDNIHSEATDTQANTPPTYKLLKMSEVFEIRNGYTPSKNNADFWDGGTIPWFRMEDIRLNGRILSDSIQHITPKAIKGKGLFEKDTFIIATTATIGEHAWLIADSLANQRFTNLKVRKSLTNNILPGYIFYYLFIIDEWCKRNTNASSFASVDMNKFKELLIPIPSLAEQKRIVDILDRFEALTSDLSAGLPAEIEARQKQYEYYRNRLLTFQRSNA